MGSDQVPEKTGQCAIYPRTPVASGRRLVTGPLLIGSYQQGTRLLAPQAGSPKISGQAGKPAGQPTGGEVGTKEPA